MLKLWKVTVHSVPSNTLRDAQKSCFAWFRAAILGFSVNFVHKKHLAEYYLWTVAPLSPASFRHLTPLRHVPKSCTAKIRTLPPAKHLRNSIINLFPCWNLPGIRVWTSYVCRNLYTFSQIMYQTSCISEMILRGLIAALPVSNSTI